MSLRSLVRQVQQAYEPMMDALPGLIKGRKEEMREDASILRRVREFLELAGSRVVPLARSIATIARRFASRVADWQRMQIERQALAALGIDLHLADTAIAALLDDFEQENVVIVRNLPGEIAQRVERVVIGGLARGEDWSVLRLLIIKQFAWGRDRAKALALNQVAHLFGQVTRARCQELGIEAYVWETMRDEAVRPAHEERQGHVFSWDDPPSDGHPGEPWGCRCWPTPAFGELADLVEESD
jgi:SPP1 gp7 family putative phage head morphogenesis protein